MVAGMEEYDELNKELKMLLYSVEQVCGLEVGGGEVFTDMTRRKEIADTKHIFIYIAIIHLEYSHMQLKNWLGIKYLSNITYALSRVEGLIKYNVAYRNRIYNVAVDMGIMTLIYHIIRIVDKNNNK